MTTFFVDTWQGSLSVQAGRVAELSGCLSDAELVKAAAIKDVQARERFCVVRGLLRMTLAMYLDAKPQGLVFAVGEHGKPYLPEHELFFNLSHSHDQMLLAVSDVESIGVDVERIQSRSAMTAIAKRCFSVREFAYWSCAPLSEQVELFFGFWTIKEAFVKAVGRGLALGLERCEVDVDGLSRFASVPQDYGMAGDWKLERLACHADYAAALVLPSVDCIRCSRQL